jgi:hypothetical protein
MRICPFCPHQHVQSSNPSHHLLTVHSLLIFSSSFFPHNKSLILLPSSPYDPLPPPPSPHRNSFIGQPPSEFLNLKWMSITVQTMLSPTTHAWKRNPLTLTYLLQTRFSLPTFSPYSIPL